MESSFRLGQLVESLTGRDRGTHYLVVGQSSGGYWQVADGQKRTLGRPKLKNARHLRGHPGVDLELEARLIRKEPVKDQDVVQGLARLRPRKEEMKA